MKHAFVIVVVSSLAGFLVWYYGPDILGDLIANKQTLDISYEYEIEDAECRTKVSLISRCTVEIRSVITEETETLKLFVIGDIGGETVLLLSDPDTGHVTTSVGIEYLTNRILTLISFVGLLLFGLTKYVQRLMRS
ncbi:MAG: hypothetical protein AAGH74_04340 [Pseudomonadota bacterium]